MRVVGAFTIALMIAASSPATAVTIPTPRDGATLAVPLYGTVVAAWNAPEDDPFAAGHRGIDVSAPIGTPVRASAPGVVSFAGNVAGNKSVTIDHADQIKTTYSYLDTVIAKKGQTLKQGDVLGTVGRGHPGSTLPSHVHLSVRRNNAYIDPLPLYVGNSYADLIDLVA